MLLRQLTPEEIQDLRRDALETSEEMKRLIAERKLGERPQLEEP